ncbi:MAG: hypothetical protein FD174_2602 [Geobacteraceae bacterium]|nr:MAG: hypothetical protein FD174_2602 [Geobacteraceae bacterium]
MKNIIAKFKEFFSATVRFPGCGIYAGCGKYAGFKPKFDRYGIVINIGWLYVIVCYYNFVQSSGNVMAENMELRKENQLLNAMFAHRANGRKVRLKP